MCVYSMVADDFNKRIPDWIPSPDIVPSSGGTSTLIFGTSLTAEELKCQLAKLLEDFKKAIEAAKIVDELTGQADCEDPEKVKLWDRVAELEALLKTINTFEVKKKGGLKLPPGKYKIVNNEIWKIEEKKIE